MNERGRFGYEIRGEVAGVGVGVGVGVKLGERVPCC